MNFLGTVLPWIQIILAVLLTAAILIQQGEAGLGGAFGMSSVSNPFQTKRGLEKTLFIATIVLATLFIISAILGAYLKI